MENNNKQSLIERILDQKLQGTRAGRPAGPGGLTIGGNPTSPDCILNCKADLPKGCEIRLCGTDSCVDECLDDCAKCQTPECSGDD
jgi:hypothetical protein